LEIIRGSHNPVTHQPRLLRRRKGLLLLPIKPDLGEGGKKLLTLLSVNLDFGKGGM
jgi:hypothetical protein